MKLIVSGIAVAVAFAFLAGCRNETKHEEISRASTQRPNILIIVADDMGYTDIAPFGGEVATPNLTELAQRGVRLVDFHTAPVCSPTRAMLMTGLDNHAVGLGTMAEALSVFPALAESSGYAGSLSRDVPTLAEQLRARGYRTYMTGKWHLGKDDNQSPKARGFDRSFALLEGVADHYGLDQDGAWRETAWATSYREDGEPSRFPIGSYSADYFTDRLIGYLSQDAGQDVPFFAYLAFTQPHAPLQAPAETIAKYRGRYDGGWEALRAERIATAQRMGVLPSELSEGDLPPMPDWEALSAEEQTLEARKMEVYAAMVDRMDQNIGRVLAALKASGRLQNTIVIFFSDNGPAGFYQADHLSHAQAVYAPTDPEALRKLGIDNRLENIGLPASRVGYHVGWALAGTGPFRGAKGSLTEGGIRTSAIVAGPDVVEGEIVAAVTHVMDILPTALNLADGRAGTLQSYQGRSWRELLAGRAAADPKPRVLGWEGFFNRAVRDGRWKAVWLSPINGRYGSPTGEIGEWKLFDLSSDPSEVHDLSAAQPQVLSKLEEQWREYASRNGVIDVTSPLARPASKQ